MKQRPSHKKKSLFCAGLLAASLFGVSHSAAAQIPFGFFRASSASLLSVWAGQIGGPGSVNGVYQTARTLYPSNVASDGSGNLFFADGNNVLRKMDTTGNVTTIAGLLGKTGSADGTGSAARFNNPNGIAVDGSGNIYVADSGNNTIRKVTSAGVVTTLAGTAGVTGYADGTTAAAKFNGPRGITLDPSGNIYVADGSNNAIRKITTAGVVSTYAGTGGTAGSADGPAASATFSNPIGLTADASGNLYVSDTGNSTIRKITTSGIVSTIAGSAGSTGFVNANGTAARFNEPVGIVINSAGVIFVNDFGNDVVRQIGTDGTVSTFAGSGAFGFNDGTGSAAKFSYNYGLGEDASGNLYVADYYNNLIRKITPAAVVTTIVGKPPNPGYADGIGSAARFYNPSSITADASGNVYVADASNNMVRKISAANATVSTLAGQIASGSTDGTGTSASFYYPTGVAADSSGNIYVADNSNRIVRKISSAGVVTTLAGTAGNLGNADGVGPAAQFFTPDGIAVSSTGTVYITDYFNSEIRQILPDGTTSTLAGSQYAYAWADGTGTAAKFYNPFGIAVDPTTGNIIVGDTYNHVIRKVTTAGVVTTIAGTPSTAGYADGTGSSAMFNTPQGVAVDSSGNIYVADSGNYVIRKITPAGVVTTVVGVAGQLGVVPTYLPASLGTPTGVAVSGNYLYISSENSVLRCPKP